MLFVLFRGGLGGVDKMQQKISDLETVLARMETKLQHIEETVKEIKSRQLSHTITLAGYGAAIVVIAFIWQWVGAGVLERLTQPVRVIPQTSSGQVRQEQRAAPLPEIHQDPVTGKHFIIQEGRRVDL